MASSPPSPSPSPSSAPQPTSPVLPAKPTGDDAQSPVTPTSVRKAPKSVSAAATSATRQSSTARKRTKEKEKETAYLPDVTQLSIATGGALLVGLLYLALPPQVVLGPRWLPLVIEAILLAPPIIALFTDRRVLPYRLGRALAIALLAVVTIAQIGSITLMVINLPQLPQGGQLLRAAALIWGLNVLVFAVWYWETDGGGPASRHRRGHKAADFQFPQQANGNPDHWKPGFIDYLFLAFCTATALSPADTMPLTRLAKMLMIIEALISMLSLVLLIGRSINII